MTRTASQIREPEPERTAPASPRRGVWPQLALYADELESETPPDPGLNGEWSVPWSDLMMVMFVLFAALFSYQAAERRFATRPEPPAASALPGSLFDQSQAAVRATRLEDVEVILQADRSVRLSLHGPLLFDLGKADLKPATRPLLDEVANIIRSTPCAVEVIGHTDAFPISTPEFPTNWELSAARASRVARYLIDSGGIDPARFRVVGHSLYRPVTSNSSLNRRARNRRVEIILEPEVAWPDPAAPDPIDIESQTKYERKPRP